MHIILGSASPRRKALLEALGYSFEVQTQDGPEDYPTELKGSEITDFLAQTKASRIMTDVPPNTVLLTADTIVWMENRVLEKPRSSGEARRTLLELSGKTHEVITSVCFRTSSQTWVSHAITEVEFAALSQEECDYYIEAGNPMDKAGAYGIQEWIGMIGVVSIKGSYTNVMGLPTHLVYRTLKELATAGF
ncbi:septum formation protein [Robiginitalea myxolifaciens]|uniref:dTTP/UTP pyrophosphatase n=2 Tax=Robiginitalea myxolifaciens TaxID=400055 RepID=A0A1I6H0W5_9FLAO|nr:septum formation protein [Robiginitalea myxolifaciens]